MVGKQEGERPFGRPMNRGNDNINMYLQDMGKGTRTGFIWCRIGTGGGLL